MPFIIIVAGPNGAGKTTFSRRLLARIPDVPFINADEIAKTLPASIPNSARDLRAGRQMIETLDGHVAARDDFMLETTLATRRYLTAIPAWRALGYEVDLYFLRLPSADTAIERVQRRVAACGHPIPEAVVRRRFQRSLDLFEDYKPLVDTWYLFDSLEGEFDFVLSGANHEP